MVNKATLVGNVGKDPEIRATKSGSEIASFSLATSEYWKDKNTGERKDKTEWHRVVVFNEVLVGVVKQFVNKGSKLYIEGKIQTRKWTDQSGQDKYTTEIVLQGFDSRIELLDSKNEKTDSFKETASNMQEQSYNNQLDDDIPF